MHGKGYSLQVMEGKGVYVAMKCLSSKKEEEKMLENYCTNFLLPSLCAELLLFQDESAVKTTIAVSKPFTSSCQRKEKC